MKKILQKKFLYAKELFHEKIVISKIKQIKKFKYEVYYSKNYNNLLTNLCEKYGSDKGFSNEANKKTEILHSYTDYYHAIFSRSRFQIKNLFECGIGSNDKAFSSAMEKHFKPGASLRMWKKYFPRAKIVGVDIDKRTLFHESRIQTFQMDQTDSNSIKKVLLKMPNTFFDIIIDDGLHSFDAGFFLFKKLAKKLAPNGIYLIEDVKIKDIPKYLESFKKLNFKMEAISFYHPGSPLTDNNIIKIEKNNH